MKINPAAAFSYSNKRIIPEKSLLDKCPDRAAIVRLFLRINKKEMESINTQQKTIGILIISGAAALLIPYTILTITSEYPDILRQDTATILTRFHEGGSRLIWTWFAFAITGLPLIPAFVLLGQRLESKAPLVRLADSP